jgi:hypothetical protein
VDMFQDMIQVRGLTCMICAVDMHADASVLVCGGWG